MAPRVNSDLKIGFATDDAMHLFLGIKKQEDELPRQFAAVRSVEQYFNTALPKLVEFNAKCIKMLEIMLPVPNDVLIFDAGPEKLQIFLLSFVVQLKRINDVMYQHYFTNRTKIESSPYSNRIPEFLNRYIEQLTQIASLLQQPRMDNIQLTDGVSYISYNISAAYRGLAWAANDTDLDKSIEYFQQCLIWNDLIIAKTHPKFNESVGTYKEAVEYTVDDRKKILQSELSLQLFANCMKKGNIVEAQGHLITALNNNIYLKQITFSNANKLFDQLIKLGNFRDAYKIVTLSIKEMSRHDFNFLTDEAKEQYTRSLDIFKFNLEGLKKMLMSENKAYLEGKVFDNLRYEINDKHELRIIFSINMTLTSDDLSALNIDKKHFEINKNVITFKNAFIHPKNNIENYLSKINQLLTTRLQSSSISSSSSLVTAVAPVVSASENRSAQENSLDNSSKEKNSDKRLKG